jgi:hypothetical protein
MIELVISGGQTGADQAGWRAAKASAIKTCGWMPKGFKTEDGPRPEFAEMYGAKEDHSSQYPPRTRANVNAACVCIWFGNPKSPGGKLTLDWARMRGAFTYVVESSRSEWQPTPLARHIYNAFEQQKHFPKGPPGSGRAINIAGNRESSAPGIGAWVEAYLIEVFRLLKEQG